MNRDTFPALPRPRGWAGDPGLTGPGPNAEIERVALRYWMRDQARMAWLNRQRGRWADWPE